MTLKAKALYTGVLLVALVLVSASGYFLASAQRNSNSTDVEQRTLTVSGTGIIYVEPDLAKLNVGVQTQEETAKEAAERNAEKMAAIIKALSSLGINEDDIETVSYNIYPVYSEDYRHIIGYRVENNLLITIRDLTMIGEVIDETVNAGANKIYGVSFTLSDEKAGEVKLEALREATEAARAKAEVIAETLGVQLVSVIHVTEGQTYYYPYFYKGANVETPLETPIVPGDVRGYATVQVTYLIN